MPIAIALDTVLALFKRYKSLFLIAPLLIALGVQTARIEGFLWWDGYKANLAQSRAEVKAIKTASEENARLAWAQKERAEAESRKLAKDAQDAYDQARAATRTRLADYSGRMRLDKVCRSNPAAAAKGNDPGVPAGLPADSDLVAVRETDLQALVEWLAIGVEARNNAVDKVNAGKAIPAVEFGREGLAAPN